MTRGRATEDYGEIIAMDKSYERLRSLLENPGTADGLFVKETERLLEDLRLHQESCWHKMRSSGRPRRAYRSTAKAPGPL